MIAYWIILFFVQPKVVLTNEQVTVDSVDRQGRNHVFKVGVQFLGLGYCTEHHTDSIPSFVDCSLFRNGNHTLYQKKLG